MTQAVDQPGISRLRVGAAIDPVVGAIPDAAIWCRAGRVIACGPANQVDTAVTARLHSTSDVVELDRSQQLALPGLVNAHAHLDLGFLPRKPFDGDFVTWAKGVGSARFETDDAEIRRAVLDAMQASAEAGVAVLGDIAGSETAVEARAAVAAEHALAGISWLEVFGISPSAGRATELATERLRALRSRFPAPAFDIELQPHAPYSAGLPLYRVAASGGRPSTHLSETPEELEFVREANGPFRDLLVEIGKWTDEVPATGGTPVAHLAACLDAAPFVLAHLNYATDEDLDRLVSTESSIAYCPVASDYFGHRDHRYREMAERGINVCLGTDSISCQPSGESQPHGILPQARHLWRRDRTDPDLLFRMATVNGARALGLEASWGSLSKGFGSRFALAPLLRRGSETPWRDLLEADVPLEGILVA